MKIIQIDIEKLDDFMAREKLTNKQLADRAKISERVIYRLKVDPSHFSSKTLNALAMALNVNSMDLISEIIYTQ